MAASQGLLELSFQNDAPLEDTACFSLVLRGDSPPESLSPIEWTRYARAFAGTYHIWEHAFFSFRFGTLDPNCGRAGTGATLSATASRRCNGSERTGRGGTAIRSSDTWRRGWLGAGPRLPGRESPWTRPAGVVPGGSACTSQPGRTILPAQQTREPFPGLLPRRE